LLVVLSGGVVFFFFFFFFFFTVYLRLYIVLFTCELHKEITRNIFHSSERGILSKNAENARLARDQSTDQHLSALTEAQGLESFRPLDALS